MGRDMRRPFGPFQRIENPDPEQPRWLVLDDFAHGATGMTLTFARHPAGRSFFFAVVVGGVIPPDDFDAVRTAGVLAIFPPGTVIGEAAEALLQQLDAQLGLAQKDPSAYAGSGRDA